MKYIDIYIVSIALLSTLSACQSSPTSDIQEVQPKAQKVSSTNNPFELDVPVDAQLIDSSQPLTSSASSKAQNSSSPISTASSAVPKAGRLAFKKQILNYGKIIQGKVVELAFQFKNTGQQPLEILKADASCSCLVPNAPLIPIQPGEEGHIRTRFNSKDRIGVQQNSITLHTTGDPQTYVLTLKGEVLPLKN